MKKRSGIVRIIAGENVLGKLGKRVVSETKFCFAKAEIRQVMK